MRVAGSRGAALARGPHRPGALRRCRGVNGCACLGNRGAAGDVLPEGAGIRRESTAAIYRQSREGRTRVLPSVARQQLRTLRSGEPRSIDGSRRACRLKHRPHPRATRKSARRVRRAHHLQAVTHPGRRAEIRLAVEIELEHAGTARRSRAAETLELVLGMAHRGSDQKGER